MEEIKVISKSDAKEFEKSVNKHLEEGWLRDGSASHTFVSCQDSWGGRQRSWTEHSFVQVLKRTKKGGYLNSN